MKPVRIGNEHTGYIRLGPRLPCAVMAEVGINHDGSLDRALEMVSLAADCGADLIKFQYLDPDVMVHEKSLPEVYQIYKKYALTIPEMESVARACEKRRLPLVCTVFDLEGAARMVEIGVSAFKVASCDMTHLPLVRGLGEFGLPVILSTGLADTAEVAAAVRAAKRGGCRDLVLLHCVSAYPAPDNQVNLRAIETIWRRFRLPVGFSDHTGGTLAPALAAVLGAVMVEKHFTYDTQAPGPDHSISLGPEDFRSMVGDIRRAELMRGQMEEESKKSAVMLAKQILHQLGKAQLNEDYLRRSALRVLRESDELDKLIAAAEKQHETNPQAMRPLIDLWHYYSAAERHRKAARTAEKALALRPDDMQLQYQYTTALLNSGLYEEAMKRFEIVMQNNYFRNK